MKTIDKILNKFDNLILGFDLLISDLDDSPESEHLREAYETDKTDLFISKQNVKMVWEELEKENLEDNQ